MLLASRSGPAAAGVPALAAEVAAAGTGVRVVACDVADRGALAILLAQIPAEAPLAGVVHAAGVLDDGVTQSLTPDRIDTVMRPKADAAWYLHELTKDMDLASFVLFSSAAATFGSAGQGNYAAANAFLDGLAAARRAAGQPAVSVAWGLWAEASAMTAHLGSGDQDRISRGGMTALTAADGLALLDAAASRDEPALVAAHLDLAGLRAAVQSGQIGPGQIPGLLRGLAGAPVRQATGITQAASHQPSLQERLADVAEAEQGAVILDMVCAQAAAVLGHSSASSIETGREFRELGFDSLTGVEFRNRLNTVTGLRLPSTMVFDYPTPVILADYLRREVMGGGVNFGAAALAEFGKLEKIVQNIAADDGVRTDLAIRVKALLATLQIGGDVRTDEVADDALETATVENIFDILDKEFKD